MPGSWATSPRSSWTGSAPATTPSATEGAVAIDIAALIDRYDAAWNGQDLDAIASMHDDAIVFHNHTAGERVDGAAAVREHIGAIFARWPTLRFERRALRVGDDFAVSEWTAHATHPDDGRELEWDGVDVFPIAADGRIARKDVYSTSATPRVLSTRPSARIVSAS